ncbi:hypothetical protein J6590_073375, partial [Homalodisca vitripennis]
MNGELREFRVVSVSIFHQDSAYFKYGPVSTYPEIPLTTHLSVASDVNVLLYLRPSLA